MKVTFAVLLCFCFKSTFAQKLNITSLEALLHFSHSSADSLLKKSGFKLADKDAANGYDNYYYTSQVAVENGKQLLRTLSYMDVYDGTDTSRFMLYRTYQKEDQEELIKQLSASGYVNVKRTGNDVVYKKGDYTIANRIAEKNVPGGKPVTAYEFELGR